MRVCNTLGVLDLFPISLIMAEATPPKLPAMAPIATKVQVLVPETVQQPSTPFSSSPC